MKFEIIDNRELDLTSSGDDGDLYSVLFDFGGDAPRPVFWGKVAVNE